MNNSFVFYDSYAKGIRTLPEEEQLTLLNAVIDYMLFDKEPQLEGVAYGMFCLIVPTAEAACKRHKDKQNAAHKRWQKKEEEAPRAVEEASEEAEEKPIQKQEKPPLPAPASGRQPAVPAQREYHVGSYHNVFLSQQEYDDLQEKLGDDFEMYLNWFSQYKMAHHFTLLYDYAAFQYYLKHKYIPEHRFDRPAGAPLRPDG